MKKDDEVLFELATPRPICLSCKHLKPGFTCSAFPDGIPDDIVYEGKDHDTVRPNQTGKAVYEPDPDSPRLRKK